MEDSLPPWRENPDRTLIRNGLIRKASKTLQWIAWLWI
jgi:hypothetical protein